MGRLLGSFADEDELDRPDLNKCPDCECFFDGDECPICGKVCPEEYRAGNRKAVKKKRNKGGTQYRVAFIPWYHSWWFILLMMFFSPFSIAGIVLLLTSPHKKGIKILFVTLMLIYAIASTFSTPLILGISGLKNLFSEPVDRSLSQEEYINACAEIDSEEYFRSPTAHQEEFLTLTLTVVDRVVDMDAYYAKDEYTTYYICTDGKFTFLIRDCREQEEPKYTAGDVIRIYGEGAGEHTMYDMNVTPYNAPCIYAAYLMLVG